MTNILKTTKSIAVSNAKAYRGAKAKLQGAIGYAVAQLLQGNADGLETIMRAGELVSNNQGVMHANSDGRAVWKYITHKDGLGLTGIVQWDKAAGRFKMAENWSKVAAKMDLEQLTNALTNVRWDKFQSVKVDIAFDLDKVVSVMVRRASSKGASAEQIKASLKRALAA